MVNLFTPEFIGKSTMSEDGPRFWLVRNAHCQPWWLQIQQAGISNRNKPKIVLVYAEQFLIGPIFLDIKVKLLLRKVNWNWRKNIRPADAKQCRLPKLGDTSPNGPGVDLNRFSKSPDRQWIRRVLYILKGTLAMHGRVNLTSVPATILEQKHFRSLRLGP